MANKYTVDQKDFIDGVYDFIYNDFPRKNYITLQGPPGSGKTYTISRLTEEFKEKKIIYVTYTGKAVDNLMRSGVAAKTIYSAFYKVKKDSQNLEFELLSKDCVNGIDIIVIDEISMVSRKMFNEILSLGKKVIAVGDKNQLGPVKSELNGLLDNPDYMLTTIMRQEEESGIRRLALEFERTHKFPPYGKYSEDVEVVPKDSVTIEMILSVDQAICGLNSTRNKWNSIIRRAHNRIDYYPEPGERVICCKNTPIYIGDRRIINGTTGIIKQVRPKGGNNILISFKPDWSDECVCLSIDAENFITGKFNMDKINTYCVDFGYVITVNKAQGSEWEKVLYIVDKEMPSDAFFRNVNTGITRASKKLIIAY